MGVSHDECEERKHSTMRIFENLGKKKIVIGMVHLLPLPGDVLPRLGICTCTALGTLNVGLGALDRAIRAHDENAAGRAIELLVENTLRELTRALAPEDLSQLAGA